jgi:hypothetical protein
MPTPGSVDSAVQRMMLRLSSIPHGDAVLALGIEPVVEQYVTGLLLADLSPDQIGALVCAGDYYRFAFVYEPVSRLIDVYQQRFVERRAQLVDWPRLHQLVTGVQGRSEPDNRLGISFRQFVLAAISGNCSHRLWQPQVSLLPWAHTYNRLYRPGEVRALEADLGRFTGREIAIDGVPESPPDAAPGPLSLSARYADTPAGELPADPATWRDQLVDDALYARIRGYYAWDFKLYNRSAANEMEGAQA